MIDLFSLMFGLAAPQPMLVEQSVGFYSKGSLAAAAVVPDQTSGLLKLFRPRDRRWGSDDLSELLVSTAARMEESHPGLDRLQVGDLSAKKGGKISSHASHQNGLDADLVYFRRDGREQDPQLTTGFDEQFVSAGGLTANFDVDRNWELFAALVASGRVARIFVDSAIKSKMCLQFGRGGARAQDVETLRRLRPYLNHGDHLHVRIRCPETSPRCRPQEDPPEGTGCDTVDQIDENELAGGAGGIRSSMYFESYP